MLNRRERVGRHRAPSAAEALTFALALCIGCSGRASDPARTDGASGGDASGPAAGNGGAEADPAMPAVQMTDDGMLPRGGQPGEAPAVGGGNAMPPSEICQQFLGTSAAAAPTVLILADRSGSMFDPLPPSGVSAPWFELRASALAVVQALEAEVSFGFAAFAGSVETCPRIDSVPPGLNNGLAIEGMYGALQMSPELRNSGTLGALRAAEALLADAAGNKFIWLLTDGGADYCNDANPICAVDSVVGQLQALTRGAPSVRTLVSGVPSFFVADADALQAYANAGMGQPVELTANVIGAGDINAIYDQCGVDSAWVEHFTTTGKPDVRGQTVGDYAASGGAAPVYSPLEQDTATLIQEIRSIVLGERPCVFDLALDGVTPSALATLDESARLEIDGVVIPHDAENGWHRSGDSSVTLEGEACGAVRAAPAAPSIELVWSCDP